MKSRSLTRQANAICALLLQMIACNPVTPNTTTKVAGDRRDPVDKVAAMREQAYRSVDFVFENAVFHKPIDGSAPDDIFKLAPLIVQEVPIGQPVPESLKLSGAVVYYKKSSIQMGGQSREAIEFCWQQGTDLQLGWRAIRMTLGGDGFPVIFETSAGCAADLELLFVSRTLEESSKAAHGSPLPGRRFSTEVSIDAAPRAVVARVLDDGPMPMGPFVYLDAKNSWVTTLLCRCMASQVRQFSENNYYELKPKLPSADGNMPQFPSDSASHAKRLRLPSTL